MKFQLLCPFVRFAGSGHVKTVVVVVVVVEVVVVVIVVDVVVVVVVEGLVLLVHADWQKNDVVTTGHS